MLYRFTDPQSVLKNVEILSGRKEAQALIFAPDGAAHSTLEGIRHHLQDKGYLTLPDAIDGQNVLRVEKIGSREAFLAELEHSNYVKGRPQMLPTPRDKALHRSIKEKVGDNTKTAAGYLFTVGDGLLVGSGLLRHDYDEAAAGALWGLTGIVLAAYGKKHPDTEMGLLYRKLDEHLKKEGIEFPSDQQSLIDACKRKDGLVQHVNEFFTNNAADFHHVVQTIGGIKLAQAGFNQGNNYKGSAGLMVATGQSLGLLPEKKDSPEHHPEAYDARIGAFADDSAAAADIGENVIDAVKEKPSKPAEEKKKKTLKQGVAELFRHPLIFSGGLPFANNLTSIAGALLHEKPLVEETIGAYPENLKKRITEKADLEKAKQALVTAPGADVAAVIESPEYAEINKKLGVAAKEHDRILNIKKNVVHLPEWVPAAGGKNIQAYELNIATAACYMVANLLYAMSPKNTPCDLDRVGGLDEIYAVAANIVTSQPKDFRAPLINRFAAEFAAMPDIRATADEVASKLSAKVALIEKSPWAERVATAPAASASTPAMV